MRSKKPKCETPRCKGTPKPKKCYKCQKAAWRANNKMKAAYACSRDNAIRRGKVFELTFEQFEKFAIEYNYIQGKGRTSKSLSIDREKNELGYTIDNIRIMEFGLNASKKDKILNYNWFDKTATVTELNQHSTDGPF